MEPTPVIEHSYNKALRIAIIAVFIIFVLGIGGYLFYVYSNTNANKNEQNTTSKDEMSDITPGADETDADAMKNNTDGNQQADAMSDQNKAQDATTQNQQGQTSEAAEPTEIPPINESEPWVKLDTENGGTSIPVGEEGNIILTASSAGANISGYDIMLGYDSDKIEIIDVTSLQDTFQTVDHVHNKYVSVTGLKPPKVTKTTVFDDTPLLQYTIRAKEAGETEIRILSTKSVEKTQFAEETDDSVNMISPQVHSLKIEIE